MKRTKYLLLLLCVPFFLTGCRDIPKLENGKDVVVEINGKKFSTEDFYNELKKEYGVNVLVSMVDTSIADMELTDELKEQAKTSAQSTYDMYYAYYGNEWEKALSEAGFNSTDDYLNYLIDGEKQNLALDKYIKENVITEEEINKYYENDIFGEITVRHILIIPDVTDDMTDAEIKKAEEKALEKAKDLIEQLNDSKNLEEDFIALAKKESDDTGSASEGGLIENFTNNSGLVKEFWEASLNLEVGKMSQEPVKSTYGYHIILKIKQNEKPSFDSVRDTIISNITDELLSDSNSIYVYWAGLREKHGMVIHDDDLNDNYTATINNLKKQK